VSEWINCRLTSAGFCLVIRTLDELNIVNYLTMSTVYSSKWKLYTRISCLYIYADDCM